MDKLIARSTVSAQFVDPTVFPVRFDSLRITEVTLGGIIRIQGVGNDAAFRSAVTKALRVTLPEPERSTSNGAVRLAWAGPNAFVCFCPLDEEEQCESRLTAAFAGRFATVTPVSDSRVGFRIAGEEAASFISKGCAIDMHPEHFDVGRALTTRFAGLPAMLIRDEGDGYVVYLDIGYIEFILEWIVDAAAEFCVAAR